MFYLLCLKHRKPGKISQSDWFFEFTARVNGFWGKEKGQYVPNIFLIIGTKGKKQKCHQIQKKSNYLSVRDSLSALVSEEARQSLVCPFV